MYDGPLRDEPLAIELHNTRFAAGGALVDGLADAAARGWRRRRTGSGGAEPGPQRTSCSRCARRCAPRCTPRAAVAPDRPRWTPSTRRGPRPRHRAWSRLGRRHRLRRRDRADIVIAALRRGRDRADRGPHRAELRACHAPGCVLLFLKDHPRRAWCSDACGNRARQARHYARTRYLVVAGQPRAQRLAVGVLCEPPSRSARARVAGADRVGELGVERARSRRAGSRPSP